MTPTSHLPTSTFWLAGLLIVGSYAVGTVAEAKDEAPAPAASQQESVVKPTSDGTPEADTLGLVSAINRTMRFSGH